MSGQFGQVVRLGVRQDQHYIEYSWRDVSYRLTGRFIELPTRTIAEGRAVDGSLFTYSDQHGNFVGDPRTEAVQGLLLNGGKGVVLRSKWSEARIPTAEEYASQMRLRRDDTILDETLPE